MLSFGAIAYLAYLYDGFVVMIIAGALVVSTRYLAIGLGDTALYVMAGFGAAMFLAARFFMSRGSSGGATG